MEIIRLLISLSLGINNIDRVNLFGFSNKSRCRIIPYIILFFLNFALSETFDHFHNQLLEIENIPKFLQKQYFLLVSTYNLLFAFWITVDSVRHSNYSFRRTIIMLFNRSYHSIDVIIREIVTEVLSRFELLEKVELIVV